MLSLSGENVNLLVLDTEMYSNTGGQMSKSTPLAAVVKYASSGKPKNKKNLALHAISYEHVIIFMYLLLRDQDMLLSCSLITYN